jgi:hypothetical protein
MAFVYSTNTGTVKYGAQVATALDGARQFLPAFQHCPARNLASQGHPDFGVDDYGRIAPIQSIDEAGYCGGQKDANARILVENCVSRPRYILKEGLVGDDDLSYCDGSAASGQPADGSFTDSYTLGGLKSGATRYQGDLYTLPQNPLLSQSAYQGAPPRTCAGRLAVAQASGSVVGQNPAISQEAFLVRSALTGTGGQNVYTNALGRGNELGAYSAGNIGSGGPRSNENGVSQQTASDAYRLSSAKTSAGPMNNSYQGVMMNNLMGTLPGY